MADRKDWLDLCNDKRVPFNDFISFFCDRCSQKECTRSQWGKSAFEKRAQNWEKQLFEEVPRMDPSDPRFAEMSAKKFLTIVGSEAPSGQSEWLDVQEVEKKQVEPAPAPPTPAPPTVSAMPEKVVETAKLPPLPTSSLQNTPNRGPQMIGGGLPKPAQPVLDPWAPKPPADPNDRVVQPGAKIKFGG